MIPVQTVAKWTGAEVRALREAKRLSVREFARCMGVSDRIISKWESSHEINPRSYNQQALDILLSRCSLEERMRFAMWCERVKPPISPELRPDNPMPVVRECLQRADVRLALAARDIAAVFKLLGKRGISQRQIAAITGQSQSEISEVLSGRRIVSYEVLARIADGLEVPRGWVGLAYDESTAMLVRERRSAE